MHQPHWLTDVEFHWWQVLSCFWYFGCCFLECSDFLASLTHHVGQLHFPLPSATFWALTMVSSFLNRALYIAMTKLLWNYLGEMDFWCLRKKYLGFLKSEGNLSNNHPWTYHSQVELNPPEHISLVPFPTILHILMCIWFTYQSMMIHTLLSHSFSFLFINRGRDHPEFVWHNASFIDNSSILLDPYTHVWTTSPEWATVIFTCILFSVCIGILHLLVPIS